MLSGFYLHIALVIIMFVAISVSSRKFALRTSARAPFSMNSKCSGRIPANGVSMDIALISNKPEVLYSHLRSRRASSEMVKGVERLSELRSERNAYITEGDRAKSIRKKLSKEIGQLMKNGKHDEAVELKIQVEDANILSAQADTRISSLDSDIDAIFAMLPNLLDDRCLN